MLRYTILIIALLFVLLFSFTHVRVQQIYREYPPKGEFVSVDGLKLHYVRKGNGRPIVLLHGRDGALQEFMLSFFEQLADEFDVIALNRPGYGHSDWPKDDDLSLDVQAELIHQALQRLHITNPLMVGHSYGGAVALQYVLEFQEEVRGIVLLAPTSFMEDPPEGALFRIPKISLLGPLLTHTLLLPVGARLAPRIYDQAFYPEPAPKEYVEVMTALYLRPSNFKATAGELSVMQDSLKNLSHNYEQIEIPVAIVFGTADRMVDFEQDGQRLADVLPNGKLIRVEGTGHKLHHTYPDIVIQAINDAAHGF